MIKKSLPFTDARDGKKYNTVFVGMRWMAENLNYLPQIGKSCCYGNDNSNCDKYGRLYNWNTAMMVCPAGWHLPSRGDWDHLVGLVGKENAGKKLMSKNGWNNNSTSTDDYGFSALPGGYRNSDGSFEYIGYAGYWWTSTENGRDVDSRYMFYNNDGVINNNDDKSLGLSVRCVED